MAFGALQPAGQLNERHGQIAKDRLGARRHATGGRSDGAAVDSLPQSRHTNNLK